MGEDLRFADPNSVPETLVSRTVGVHFRDGLVTIPFAVTRTTGQSGDSRLEHVIVSRLAMSERAFSEMVAFLVDAATARRRELEKSRVESPALPQ